MEIAITALTIIVSLQIIFNVILAISNDNLKSKINKQQKQIDELIYKHNNLIGLCKDITDICKKIATKVVSIEETIDNKN